MQNNENKTERKRARHEEERCEYRKKRKKKKKRKRESLFMYVFIIHQDQFIHSRLSKKYSVAVGWWCDAINSCTTCINIHDMCISYVRYLFLKTCQNTLKKGSFHALTFTKNIYIYMFASCFRGHSLGLTLVSYVYACK